MYTGIFVVLAFIVGAYRLYEYMVAHRSSDREDPYAPIPGRHEFPEHILIVSDDVDEELRILKTVTVEET